MKISGINKNTMIMTKEEFVDFMKDKTVYHHQCYWSEKWNGTDDITKYVPCNNFVLENKYTLKKYPYHGYSAKCLSSMVEGYDGKGYWEFPYWEVSINERNHRYYVTFCDILWL